MDTRAWPGSRAVRLLRGLILTTALVGLFAMHGLPMTMNPMAGMSMADGTGVSTTGVAASAAHTDVTTGTTGSTSGTGQACPAGHDGCVATRHQVVHLDTPSLVLVETGAASAHPSTPPSPTSTGRQLRAPPPDLTKLCVSRT